MTTLAIIPARGGSKRIPNKNIRNFCDKPLIAYTIEQALATPFITRVIVDTDSKEIAKIAKTYGAEVPFIRPSHFATDKASINDALRHLLSSLKKEEGYEPDYIVLLQTTSPLREIKDIEACWKLMKKSKADTTLTVAPTHPRLYYMNKQHTLTLANKVVSSSTNSQEWPSAYLLNGCFVYILKTSAFLEQGVVIMKNTKAVVCDKWRSVDLDMPEDFILAEHLFKHKEEIKKNIQSA